MIRLFVALRIPEEVKDKIIETRNSLIAQPENYKWEPRNKLHVTIKFIGDVNPELVDKIIESLKFVEDFTAFNCSLTQFGFFYVKNKPKILWAGLKIDDYINDLVQKINKSLETFSIPKDDRKFKAHLTLLRLKGYDEKDFVRKFDNFVFNGINFTAGEVTLFSSELLRTGSVYKEIKTYKLKNN
jgi:RNA 2',3'-cyclic 3'-phosphodiesterase